MWMLVKYSLLVVM